MSLLIYKALLGLLAYDVLGFDRDFSRMHKFVRRRPVSPRVAGADAVRQVCNAVNSACVVYPKHVLCLQRAAVTTCLLRNGGVPARLVLGAQKVPFEAHAWTEVDGCAVNELRNVEIIYGVWERC
jgi:hypothetical protein